MQKTAFTLALLIGSCGLATAQSPASGDAANGQAVHGRWLLPVSRDGRAGLAWHRAPARPQPGPLRGFAQQLRKPANVMPPYSALVLSDAQLADIYAYVSSLPGPAKPRT
jgi:hypothetical protein